MNNNFIQVMGIYGVDEASTAANLHLAYKWYSYANKNSLCIPNAQVLLIKAYKSHRQAVDHVSFTISDYVNAQARGLIQLHCSRYVIFFIFTP